MDLAFYLINAAVTAGVAVVAVLVWRASRRRIAEDLLAHARQDSERAARDTERLLADARREADALRKEALIEAKEHAHELRLEGEKHLAERREALARAEQDLARRDAAIAEQRAMFEQQQKALRAREQVIVERERATAATATRYEQLIAERQRELERVAGLTAEDARELLVKQMEADARHEAAQLLKRLENEARETAAQKAREIVVDAIQRSAAEHSIETTVSVVDLPSDDMKGRIIGREGRNIRALELATGVDLIVDDTPGAIILSSYDPYRREIARQAIERLIADGRIHPARIEEVVEKVKAEMEDSMRKDGSAAAFELGLHDLHPEVHRMLGKLKYRTSYGQNVLNHSKEVAVLAGLMARELGINQHVATRAAFLHDIGKAIDRELQGTHLELGIEFLRRHGEPEPVVLAMAAHHMDIAWPSLEAMIVQAADAMSAARPGARRDLLETYVKRLEKLEGIADSFKGVSKAFALQAGREVRIMVESDQVSDEEAVWLSRDIARRIESELQFPGQIKVTVIRETRAIEYAK